MKKKKYRELHYGNENNNNKKNKNVKEQVVKKESTQDEKEETKTTDKENLEDTKVLFSGKGILKDIFKS